MATAKTTAAPRTRAAKAATPKAAEVETTETAADAEANLERLVYVLDNRGRTKGGEGKQLYFNLHETGARGQVFTDPDVVEVKVLIVRNKAAVV